MLLIAILWKWFRLTNHKQTRNPVESLVLRSHLTRANETRSLDDREQWNLNAPRTAEGSVWLEREGAGRSEFCSIKQFLTRWGSELWQAGLLAALLHRDTEHELLARQVPNFLQEEGKWIIIYRTFTVKEGEYKSRVQKKSFLQKRSSSALCEAMTICTEMRSTQERRETSIGDKSFFFFLLWAVE